MKLTRILQLLSAALLGVCAASFGNAQTLIAGWDFQTTTTGGTAAAAAPGSPLVYQANFGSGTIYLDGTNSSSTWTSLSSNPQVTSFGGTALNAGTGFSTTTSGAASLALANSSANNFSAVFKFSMTGYKDLTMSYAFQKTATGFNSIVWETSTDGSSWTSYSTQSYGAVAVSFATVVLGTTSNLDNATTAYVRLTVSGASATSGNNRYDNIQLVATAVPEPSSFAALAGAGALGFCALRRRRSV